MDFSAPIDERKEASIHSAGHDTIQKEGNTHGTGHWC